LQKSQFRLFFTLPAPDPRGVMGQRNKQRGLAMNRRERKSWSRTIAEGVAMIAVVLLIGLVAHAAHLLR
jgi:hypothetical protein